MFSCTGVLLNCLQKTKKDDGLTWQYAAVTSDYNPIHLWPWVARVFGFPTTVAHGMSVVEKAVPTLLDFRAETKKLTGDEEAKQLHQLGCVAPLETPVSANFEFRKPLFVPTKGIDVFGKVEEDETKDNEQRQQISFTLYDNLGKEAIKGAFFS